MPRRMLKSKIRRATVTDCDVVEVDSDPSVLLGDANPDQEALL